VVKCIACRFSCLRIDFRGYFKVKEGLMMSDEKETYIGPVEQEINSLMETAGNEIMDLTQEGPDRNITEKVQNIHITNLSKCIIYLAKQFDKLAGSIK